VISFTSMLKCIHSKAARGEDSVRFLTLHMIYILTLDQMKRLLNVRDLKPYGGPTSTGFHILFSRKFLASAGTSH
jgi:hypothetical protein